MQISFLHYGKERWNHNGCETTKVAEDFWKFINNYPKEEINWRITYNAGEICIQKALQNVLIQNSDTLFSSNCMITLSRFFSRTLSVIFHLPLSLLVLRMREQHDAIHCVVQIGIRGTPRKEYRGGTLASSSWQCYTNTIVDFCRLPCDLYIIFVNIN